MKNIFKRTLCLLLAMTLVFSLTACAPKAEGGEDETPSSTDEVLSEDVSRLPSKDAESETSEESGGDSVPEATAVAHSCHWGLREYQGVYQIELEIETNGIPSEAGSTIRFSVRDTVHDYKVYDMIKCQGELLVDKNTNPDWTDSVYGGDGIFGFPGDGFTIVTEEGYADQDGRIAFAFCHKNMDGNWMEDVVTWEKDGNLSVNNGVITEIGDLSKE